MPIVEQARDNQTPNDPALHFLPLQKQQELITRYGASEKQKGLDPEEIAEAVGHLTDIAKQARITNFLTSLTERTLRVAYRKKFGHGIASGYHQEHTEVSNEAATPQKRKIFRVFSRQR